MEVLDGSAVAARLRARLRELPGIDQLTLGIVTATDDPATAAYVAAKQKAAAEVGIGVELVALSPSATEDEVIAACQRLNNDRSITAYIVQLPLPDEIAVSRVLLAVDPQKDADGLTPTQAGKLLAGEPNVIPATPKGIISLLSSYGIEVASKAVTIVGKGRLTGAPLAVLLSQLGATVIACDRQTADLAAMTTQAEIVIVAAGAPGLITPEMVRDGAVVVDVGTTEVDQALVGDVAAGVDQKAAYLTPVPGGVGPMTVVSLLENVAQLGGSR